MTNKTLNTLTNKYDPLNISPFNVKGSEILFYSTLDSLEFYYKNILLKWNPLNSIRNEEDKDYYESINREVIYLKKITKETIEFGKKILDKVNFNQVREFYKKVSEILVFAEEIAN